MARPADRANAINGMPIAGGCDGQHPSIAESVHHPAHHECADDLFRGLREQGWRPDRRYRDRGCRGSRNRGSQFEKVAPLTKNGTTANAGSTSAADQASVRRSHQPSYEKGPAMVAGPFWWW